jgi:MFS family permease
VIGVVGTFAAGPIADLIGWRSTFAFYLICAALLFVLAIATIPRVTAAPLVAPARSAQFAPDEGFVKRFMPIYAWMIPFAVIMMINGAQLSFLLSADGVNSATVQSWIIGLGGVFSATGSASYGFIRAKCGPKISFALVPICLGGGTFIIGLSHHLWLQAIGSGLTGLGCGIIVPHFYTMIYERATPGTLSRALGWMLSAMFFGDFINPFILGSVLYFTGIHNMFVIVGLVVVSLAVSPWLPRPAWKRPSP